jgi:predicted hydrocarbon binding protein
MAFHRAIDRLYGRGDLAMCREIGRFSADWQLNSFHKLVLRWKSPRWMVEKAGTMWRHYHDTGRWEIVEQPDRNVVTGRLYEFHFVDAAFCMREQGWFERAVELTGGRQPVVRELRCRARGDDACEYSGTWS